MLPLGHLKAHVLAGRNAGSRGTPWKQHLDGETHLAERWLGEGLLSWVLTGYDESSAIIIHPVSVLP